MFVKFTLKFYDEKIEPLHVKKRETKKIKRKILKKNFAFCAWLKEIECPMRHKKILCLKIVMMNNGNKQSERKGE